MRIGSDPPEKLRLTGLERAVLQALADRLGDAGPALSAQLENAVVTARSYSGVGFVTRLQVSGAAGLPESATRRGSVLLACHPDLPEPAEFFLQFKEGRLATIEAYCHQGQWPADESLFHIGGPAR
jgi:hypothetical protein